MDIAKDGIIPVTQMRDQVLNIMKGSSITLPIIFNKIIEVWMKQPGLLKLETSLYKRIFSL